MCRAALDVTEIEKLTIQEAAKRQFSIVQQQQTASNWGDAQSYDFFPVPEVYCNIL